MAYRWRRAISIGRLPSCRSTQALSHSTSTGHTRAQVAPSRLSSKIVLAAASGLPSAISRTKRGTSTPTGQAAAHGGGAYGPAQKRQRSASNSAASISRGGLSSEKAIDRCHASSVSAGGPRRIRADPDQTSAKSSRMAAGHADAAGRTDAGDDGLDTRDCRKEQHHVLEHPLGNRWITRSRRGAAEALELLEPGGKLIAFHCDQRFTGSRGRRRAHRRRRAGTAAPHQGAGRRPARSGVDVKYLVQSNAPRRVTARSRRSAPSSTSTRSSAEHAARTA